MFFGNEKMHSILRFWERNNFLLAHSASFFCWQVSWLVFMFLTFLLQRNLCSFLVVKFLVIKVHSWFFLLSNFWLWKCTLDFFVVNFLVIKVRFWFLNSTVLSDFVVSEFWVQSNLLVMCLLVTRTSYLREKFLVPSIRKVFKLTSYSRGKFWFLQSRK
jgi:hypothetical protein